jgi:hypothetical protein
VRARRGALAECEGVGSVRRVTRVRLCCPQLSESAAAAAEGVDLVVLEGMGRWVRARAGVGDRQGRREHRARPQEAVRPEGELPVIHHVAGRSRPTCARRSRAIV